MVGIAAGGAAVIAVVATAVGWLLLIRRKQARKVDANWTVRAEESNPQAHTAAEESPNLQPEGATIQANAVVHSPPRESDDARRGGWFGSLPAGSNELGHLPEEGQCEAGERVCDGGRASGSTAAVADKLEQLEEGLWEVDDESVCDGGHAAGYTADLASQLELEEDGLWQGGVNLNGPSCSSFYPIIAPLQLPGATVEETPGELKMLLDRVSAAEASLNRQTRPTTAPPRAQGVAAAAAGRGRRGRRSQVCDSLAPGFQLSLLSSFFGPPFGRLVLPTHARYT